MACVFCQIIQRSLPTYIVWEDDRSLAFLDIRPIKEGHALLIPKTHIDHIFDLPESQYTRLFLVARKLAPVLKQVTEAQRIGIAVEGFGVPHAHIHLVPINTIGELNPERAASADEKTLRAMAEKLRKAIKSSER